MAKEQIVEELGDLLLPNLVNKALIANDRAKYLMTLLQTARAHVDHPDGGFTNLKQERVACGIDEPAFDTVVEGSSKGASGEYRMPCLQRIHEEIVNNTRSMLAPVEAAQAAHNSHDGTATDYLRRFESLTANAPSLDDNVIPGTYIDEITAVQPTGGDSLHWLVMNLHKELNGLQRHIAADSIDGALVYGVTEADRHLIACFMRGVNRTRRLKFDHPGLETTATRMHDKLVIQNDIGETDAHVVVIHISPPKATVTYTDVHIQRLVFFQNLLKRFGVQWEDTRSRQSPQLRESLYHLCVGEFVGDEERTLPEYLEFLGSRLVFLIDWNRARKRLRKFAPKRFCLEVLQWAAENDLGHMAFLKAGGEQLVFDALQLASRTPMQLSGQLSDIVGTEQASKFLKFTLRTAAEGLLAGQSQRLIHDQVRAELRHYLDTAHQGLLEIGAEHAALIVELSCAARDCIFSPEAEADSEKLSRMAERAKKWEHLADELVTKARTARGEGVEANAAVELLRIADDAADELEEGIFLLTLLEQPFADGMWIASAASREALQDLANLLVHSAQEYVKVVENARQIHRASPCEEMADFLEAVDRTISLERSADDAHRRAKASILTFSGDHKQLHLFTEVAHSLESASDAMMRASLMLRDYVLGEVITR